MPKPEELLQIPEAEQNKDTNYIVEETHSEMDSSTDTYTGTVHRVLDGDTLEVWVNGKKETIRLIGTNAPEIGHDPEQPFEDQDPYGQEALYTTLNGLIKQQVKIELDLMQADVYGRIQAWVWHDGKLLQERLLEEGHAYLDTFIPNVRHTQVLVEAQERARNNKAGLWAVDFFDHAPEEEFSLDLTNTKLEIDYANIDLASPQNYILIRRNGLGASDMATVLGVNPYKNVTQLILEKLTHGITEEEKQLAWNPNIRKGQDLEPLIVTKIKEYFKMSVWKPKHQFRIAEHPHIKINYDGVTGNYKQYYPVEIKVLTYWGEKNYNPTKAHLREGQGFQPIPDDVSKSNMNLLEKAEHYGIPVNYYVQLQTQMLGLDAPYGYLAVLPEKDWLVRIYYVWADSAVQNQIIIDSFKLWNHILTKQGRTYDQWATHLRSLKP